MITTDIFSLPHPLVGDASFLLNEVLAVDTQPWLQAMPPRDMRTPILDQTENIMATAIAPLRRQGDVNGASFAEGKVIAPPGFRQAYSAITEAGLHASTIPESEGGVGISPLVALFIEEMSAGANMALNMYYGFNAAAARTLRRFGETWLADCIVPRLISGDWTATMCLTESQAGSDLAQIRTRAIANSDGSFSIVGDKIFISAGDHDLTENIIHIVLARTQDEAGRDRPGLPGLGVFVVPKLDFATGAASNVFTLGIEHKMGLHGNPTCALRFEHAKGYSLSPGQGGSASGMAAMFDMMNHARLTTATSALGVAAAAAERARSYALERMAGQARGNKSGQPGPIIDHPDVARRVLSGMAFVESSRALLAWASFQIEQGRDHPDPDARKDASLIADLLTPILKAFVTDEAYRVCDDSIQLHGGHGYVSETGVEQFARDLRVSRIYEGANGIQAHDLVMRRLPAQQYAAAHLLCRQMRDFARQYMHDTELTGIIQPLQRSCEALEASLEAVKRYRAEATDRLLSCSTDILQLWGLVLTGWRAAVSAVVAREREPDLYDRKLRLAEHWAQYELPVSAGLIARIDSNSWLAAR